jgi:hypothetical protein
VGRYQGLLQRRAACSCSSKGWHRFHSNRCPIGHGRHSNTYRRLILRSYDCSNNNSKDKTAECFFFTISIIQVVPSSMIAFSSRKNDHSGVIRRKVKEKTKGQTVGCSLQNGHLNFFWWQPIIYYYYYYNIVILRNCYLIFNCLHLKQSVPDVNISMLYYILMLSRAK